MDNISAVTEVIKKLPQLLSSASQETWKTVSAVALGVIVSVGSAITSYKIISRYPQDQKTSQTSSTKTELLTDLYHSRKTIKTHIEEVRKGLNALKEVNEKLVDPLANPLSFVQSIAPHLLPVKSSLDQLDKALQKMNVSNPLRTTKFAELQGHVREAIFAIKNVETTKTDYLQALQFAKNFPQKLAELEWVLATLENHLDRI